MSTYAPRALPRAFSSDLARQSLAGLAVAAVAAATTVYMTSHLRLSVVAAVGMAAVSLWLATTRRTQLALAVVMLYLGLLDGFLKLESNSNLVTFVRDGLLYAVVIGLLVRASVRRERLPLPPLSGLVIAFIVLVFIQFANPNAGTLFHSLAGVRQHLEFIPLFFLTYAFVRTTKALRWFVILLAVIASANGIAGYVQLRESPQQFAAWGPGYAQRVLGTGAFAGAGRTFATSSIPGQTGGTRPFGLGSDSGDGGLFGVLALCGILALAAFSTRRRDQLFAVAMALGAVLAIISSQNRGVIASGVIILLAFGVLTAASRNRLRSLLGLALAAVASVLVIQAIIGSVGSSELRYGGLGPSSILQTTSQARGKSIVLIPHNLVTYPFGAGLATAGPAAGSVAGASQLSLNGNVNTETEFSFLTVETGIAGMLVFTAFTVTLLLLGFRRVRQEPDREARVLLAAVIAPVAGIFALFFTSDPTVSVPTGPYLWAVGGIVAYWLVALPAARRRKFKTAYEAERAPTP
jgi:hypothetical protein